MQTIKLNSGYKFPILGLGTWQSKPGEVGVAVKHALTKAGYRHIDGAHIYLNEPEIGKVYAEVFKTIKREEIFITSKLWNTSHAKDDVEKACRKTLEDLHLDYLDLYLMHWGLAQNALFFAKPISIRETWEAMENLVEKGLVKSIGVANFTAMMIHDLLTYAKIKPAMNQVELHPYNSQEELVAYCHRNKIAVTAYSPMGSPGNASADKPKLMDDSVVQQLAKKYDKSPSQILIRWAIERGTVVIPKSVTPARIEENIQVFDFSLEASDMDELNGLNRNLRYVDPSGYWGIPIFK